MDYSRANVRPNQFSKLYQAYGYCCTLTSVPQYVKKYKVSAVKGRHQLGGLLAPTKTTCGLRSRAVETHLHSSTNSKVSPVECKAKAIS